MQRWFTQTMEQKVCLEFQTAGAPTRRIQHAFGQLAQFCNILGDGARGERLMLDTIRASEESGVTKTAEYCLLLRNLGSVYCFRIKEDPENFQRALDV